MEVLKSYEDRMETEDTALDYIFLVILEVAKVGLTVKISTEYHSMKSINEDLLLMAEILLLV